jgi:translation initiation factor 2 alpha subunit (eIF-2alpha)
VRLPEVKQGISDWKKQQAIDKAMQTLAEQLETALKEIQWEIALLMPGR